MGMEIQTEDGYLTPDSARFLQQRNKLARYCAVHGVQYREEDLVRPEVRRNPYLTTQQSSGAIAPDAQPPETEVLTEDETEDEEFSETSGEDETDEEVEEVEEVEVDNYDDSEAWSIADLKNELRARGLPLTGKRPELVARLREDNASNE